VLKLSLIGPKTGQRPRKNGYYRAAADHLQWLFKNAPDLNPSIYINGSKIYENLAEAEEDPAKKAVYEDSTLLMYDLRIKYFNKEAYVLNRKAFEAYKYYKGRKEKYDELFQLFQKTFELNGDKVLNNNLVAYMDVMRRHKASGGDVSDIEAVEIYNQISNVIEHKKESGKNLERLETYQDNIDKLLTATVDVDCEFVESNLAPKMDANPDDVKMAKKIFQLLLTGKCSDSPYFLKSAKLVHEMEPSYGLAIVVAKKELANKNLETALKYYNQALELTDDNTKKGEIYLDLANSYAARDNKVQARSYSLKAVDTDPTLKQAYTLVGNLYMQSYEECKQGKNKVKDRAVFLAAYEMFKKAGNAEGMSAAREQFPSIEDIFELDMEEGQTIKVDCWINEMVTIQRRPS